MTEPEKASSLRVADRALLWMGDQPHPLFRHLTALLTRAQARLGGSAFGRRTFVMLGGTALGQAMSVLLAPLLTRLYAPDQFAALSVYMSTISIMAVIGALCYEIAIPTAQTSAEAANMLAVGFVSLLLTTAIMALLAATLPARDIEILRLNALPHIRVLIPLGFAFLASYHLMLYYGIWAQDFTTIARTRITQGFAGPLAQIGLGVADLGALGLCLGFIVGQSSGTLTLLYRLVLRQRAAMRAVSVRGMCATAWRNRAFPLISSWALMIDMAGAGQLAYILAATLYPGPLAGYMFISERVVGRPLVMLSTSMLSVYMGEIGQTVKTDPARLKARFLQVITRQFLFGAAWVLAVDGLALLAFPWLFGVVWADAVPFLMVLSVAYLLVNVVGSVGHTLQVLGRQGIVAGWQVARVSVVSAGFVLCAHYHVSAFRAILCYACLQSVACVAMLLIMNASIARLQNVVEIKPA